jgi:hypothetical protein
MLINSTADVAVALQIDVAHQSVAYVLAQLKRLDPNKYF